MRIKQSICYPLCQPEGMALDDYFGRLAAVGYAAIELWNRDDDFEEVVATAHRHGLAVASMIGHNSLEDGLNRVANHDRIEVELRESIDIAARHGIRGLICFSGNRNDGQDDDEGADVCAAGLSRVTSCAEAAGVNLNVELLNSKVDHPGYQCDHTVWGVELCRRVDSPRVGLLFDIYHMQIMEGDLVRTIQDNIAHIRHFHTAGNPGRHLFDDAQELNYRGICRAIAESGYELYVGHEFIPEGDRLEAMQTAFSICDQG